MHREQLEELVQGKKKANRMIMASCFGSGDKLDVI
jgi:hypothetical protein